MHNVHAQIAGPRHARQRVHVRAVHVQQRALGVQNLGNFRDAFFKNSQRRRIRNHQCRDVFGYQVAQLIHINLSVRFGFDVLHFVAGNHRRRWIRSMRGIWNQNFLARIALFFQVRANQEQAGEFALCPRGGL